MIKVYEVSDRYITTYADLLLVYLLSYFKTSAVDKILFERQRLKCASCTHRNNSVPAETRHKMRKKSIAFVEIAEFVSRLSADSVVN